MSPLLRRPEPRKGIRKVLVANRGEIACRVFDTLDRLGLESVAVYSDADASAMHVRRAGQAVRLGPAPVAESYLRIDKVLEAAYRSGAQAIHPGYGLLSENAGFAAACEAAGMIFIGPTPGQLQDFGRKDTARQLAKKAGLPICPGSELIQSLPEAVSAGRFIGYPLLLKAVAGGGGIGICLCRDEPELIREFQATRRQAEVNFGGAGVFLERFVERARHVEVQIFGDGEGRVVSLGERDCSLQRRRQKVFEEAPAAGLHERLRKAMEQAALGLAASVKYRSAGTVEFLVDPTTAQFYFLEVNTRLQVEHGVTELVSRVDLVEWMIRLAAGDSRFLDGYVHEPRGHAIEVRLYAEDPSLGFLPSSGPLTEVSFPHDVRVDRWVESGTEVSPFYDPLLAKVIASGRTRAEALLKLRDALDHSRLSGIATNLRYARDILLWPEFLEDRHHTRSLDGFAFAPPALRVEAPGAATAVQEYPGRLGYWAQGVPPSGPMDSLAFRVANRIVGNAEGVAGLEIAVQGPTLRLLRDAIVCVSGAPIEAELNGKPFPRWQAVPVRAGSVLRLGAVGPTGARAYLAVRGGIDVPEYLGSRASFVLGGFGGHCGRNLVAGDLLPLVDAPDPDVTPDAPLAPREASRLVLLYTNEWELRVLDGPHGSPEFFTEEDRKSFYELPFEVHYQSARTGVRLIGPRPRWARTDGGDAGLHPSNIHDTAYAVGAIDYTGDMPVILGPDGPSLGGFVCPAVVVGADLWKLGQLRAGDRVRFRAVQPEEALKLQQAQDLALAARESLRPRAPLPQRASRGPLGSGVLLHQATPQRPELTCRQSGDRYVLVEYGPMVLDLDLRVRVQLLWEALRQQLAAGALHGIIDLTPGVRSLQVHFDPRVLPVDRLLDAIGETDEKLPSGDQLVLPTRIVHLPLSWEDPETLRAIEKYRSVVRDSAPWCPSNTEFIRRINGLRSVDEVREIVFAASYLVLGLGDVYLGAPVATPLDPRHRLVTTKYNPARTWTPENAVGIGGAYLCIYGMEGPGGYQLFGRTVPVWSSYQRWRGSNAGEPWLLRFFDQIRFFPVSAEELLQYRRDVRDGKTELRVEQSVFDLGAHHRFLESIAKKSERFRSVQQAAFEAERERWLTSGEFAVAEQSERAALFAPEPTQLELAPGSEWVSALLGAQVFRVRVAQGQRVQAGEELAVLSAMKTETAVVAPRGGVIEQVLCTSGQIVAPGTPLFALRADA